MKSCDGDAEVLESCILNTVKHYRVSFILQFDCTAFTLTTYYYVLPLGLLPLLLLLLLLTIKTTAIAYSLSPFADSIFFFPIFFFACIFLFFLNKIKSPVIQNSL